MITADTVRPIVECFFKAITPEQWELLKSGSPDEITKLLVADMLLKIMTAITDAVLTAQKSQNDISSDKSVQFSLGDTLTQSFVEVLDIQDQVECTSSGRLTELMEKEVAERIRSDLSARK